MHVRLLGPIDVTVDGAARAVTGARRQAVLAVLGLRAGDVVTIDQLVDIVWGDRPPPTAVNALQRHISYLRGLMGVRAAIVARGRGYHLDLASECTDVRQAEQLIQQGQQTADGQLRVTRLAGALALWRGEALADVRDRPWLDEQARRLAELRLGAVRALIETRLGLGEHRELVPELQHLADQHPFDEEIHRQLMLALHRAGRPADALAAYRRLRRTLCDDLGVDPCPALRELEAAILRHDPLLDAVGPADPSVVCAGGPAPGPPARPVRPRQLPPVAPHFVGRTGELIALSRLADDTTGPVLITGMAGVGKTTLAVAWAHMMAPRFPDGQLYLNLRGFNPSRAPMTPDEAVRGLLEGLGVAERTCPPGLEARVGLYRSLMSDRQVLVLLDDARDADQVRALLPGSPTCRVMVTSRMVLTGLIAVDGAHPVGLDVLSDVEARQMLTRRLGPERAGAEPEAVDRLIALCGRLPIAMAIVAARAAAQPSFALSAIAEEAGGRLGAWPTGGPSADVFTVFSWSYRALTPPAARLFRLLALPEGPDVGSSAVASLAGLAGSEVTPLLSELADAHLITEPVPGRFGFHDTLRTYAIDLARTAETEPERDAARRRYLDHYAHTARRAALLIGPQLPLATLDPPMAGVRPLQLSGPDEALRWFAEERNALLGAIEYADMSGHARYAWQLATLVEEFLSRQGRFDDWIAAQRRAVAAARRVSDPEVLPRMLYILGIACWRAGRADEASDPTREARDRFRDLGDAIWQARAENLLGGLSFGQGRFDEALQHASRSLVLFGSAGDRTGEASAHNSIAMCRVHLGDHQRAIDHCQWALDHYLRSHDRIRQAAVWDTLGLAHHGLRQYGKALRCYGSAIRLVRELGERYNEATTLTRIGDIYDATGGRARAREVWREALAIYEDLDHPDGAALHARLVGPTAG